jgi:hypothetical protein
MREGLIPTLLGTGVAASGIAYKTMNMRKNRMMMMRNRNYMPMIAAGVIGFGLAHILLGSIDLATDNE